MSREQEATRIRNRAQELLRNDQAAELMIRKSGRVGRPIPILGPGKGLHAWFVPVTAGGLLAGFFEFQPDMTLKRYSSFQRREDSLDGCPAAESWLDRKSILHRIVEITLPEEKVHPPFLTYDSSPSRLAWAVVLEAPDGKTRTVFVAGDTIWERHTTTPETDSSR